MSDERTVGLEDLLLLLKTDSRNARAAVFGMSFLESCTSELAALRALNVEMLGWLGTSNAMLGFRCPCCHKYDEHAPDCKLDALLQKGTPPRPQG